MGHLLPHTLGLEQRVEVLWSPNGGLPYGSCGGIGETLLLLTSHAGYRETSNRFLLGTLMGSGGNIKKLKIWFRKKL